MLRFGHLADSSDPVMLVWGDSSDLVALSKLLERRDENPGEFKLNDRIPCTTIAGEVIVVKFGGRALGLRKQPRADKIFDWELNEQNALWFTELIQVVASSPSPCHHYLECGRPGEITVMVSHGEYPPDFPRNQR